MVLKGRVDGGNGCVDHWRRAGNGDSDGGGSSSKVEGVVFSDTYPPSQVFTKAAEILVARIVFAVQCTEPSVKREAVS